MSPSSTVHGVQHDARILHAAFTADKVGAFFALNHPVVARQLGSVLRGSRDSRVVSSQKRVRAQRRTVSPPILGWGLMKLILPLAAASIKRLTVG